MTLRQVSSLALVIATGVLVRAQSPAPDAIRFSVVKILDTPRPGSGVIVALNGTVATVLTASHVVQGATRGFRVAFAAAPDDPPLRVVPEDQLGMDQDSINGLAAFRVRNVPATVRAARIADGSALTPRRELVYWGYPGGAARVRSYGGAFSGFEGTLLLMDRSAGEGASGGPVVIDDRVVGITTSTDPQTTYAVVSDVALVALRGWGAQVTRASETAAVSSSPPATPTTATPPPASRPGTTFRDCPECPEMIVIPAGSFTMGSPPSEVGHSEDEGPQHLVTLRSFALAKTEVTVAQFRSYVMQSPARVAPCTPADSTARPLFQQNWEAPGFSQAPDHPVVCVSHADATGYFEWLSKRTGKSYRLPSEAEWEYAARAGSTTSRWWGDNPDMACNNANIADRSGNGIVNYAEAVHNCDDKYVNTSPVGTFLANRFGLFDMIGNVWEWTADCYHPSYSGAPTSGSAWTAACTARFGDRDLVTRGGGYPVTPRGARSATRAAYGNYERAPAIGFRVAMTLP